jgi:hypothetical protein
MEDEKNKSNVTPLTPGKRLSTRGDAHVLFVSEVIDALAEARAQTVEYVSVTLQNAQGIAKKAFPEARGEVARDLVLDVYDRIVAREDMLASLMVRDRIEEDAD